VTGVWQGASTAPDRGRRRADRSVGGGGGVDNDIMVAPGESMRPLRPTSVTATLIAALVAAAVAGAPPSDSAGPAAVPDRPCPAPECVVLPGGTAPVDGEPYPGMTPDPAGRGLATASCASSSCHGGPRGGNHPIWSFAATTWAGNDPHAGAYETLFEPRSLRMAKLLGIGPPHTERQCLACHSVQEGIERPLPRAVLSDGVGCASCHGDSSGWLENHSTDAWKGMSSADKSALGFTDLSGPRERARVCARCHVGDADHDMHHDHVAAGHPRLFFELAQLQRRWPRHWDPHGRAESAPDFNARSWAVGQAAALEAAADLLAARATRAAAAIGAGERARWPEFTEFDCLACHRDLAPAAVLASRGQSHPWPLATDATAGNAEGFPGRRQSHPDLPRTLPPGTPGWQPWFVTGSRWLDRSLDGDAATAELAERTAALRRLLAREWTATDATRVERIAAEARGLARVAGRSADTLAAAPCIAVAADGARLDALAAGDPRLWRSWEAAVQSTLALEAACRGGAAPLGSAAPGGPLDDLRESLLYPPGFDAPVGFDPVRFREQRDAVR